MKLKIVAIIFAVLTIVFLVLCCINIFSDSRTFFENEFSKAHQDLRENLEFQDELESYGSNYREQLNAVKSYEDAIREWMGLCLDEIHTYRNKTIVFGLLATLSGVTAIVIIVIKIKRKA